jgi:hypothetical protein
VPEFLALRCPDSYTDLSWVSYLQLRSQRLLGVTTFIANGFQHDSVDHGRPARWPTRASDGPVPAAP